ncbi:MAG TPA: TonB-dependent receptor [Acidobacteriaceae bacterium]|nr:TonB-dependent receptor [Acidobacteriaceae bacterium]
MPHTARYALSHALLRTCCQVGAVVLLLSFTGQAQAPAPLKQTLAPAAAAPTTSGGRLHGLINAGKTPLPGVTVTAANTLTGKRFVTTTDITGAWSMTIPQNGRYVIRTEFAAFASSTHEALLNAASHDQAVDFELQLASRAAAQEAKDDQQQGVQQAGQVAQAIRQLAGNGAQTLSLINSLAEGSDAAEGGSAAAGAALPGAAQNSTFSSDSVAVNGQSGAVSPLAGIDVDRIRDAIETMRAQGGTPGGGGLFGGAGFGGPGGFGGGPGGGFGGRGGRGYFRGFRPDQPHGSIFWTGNNSAINAEQYSLRGQPSNQPVYGSNQFGVTFIGEPFIPKLTKPSGKDTLFLNLSGTRGSTPIDTYSIVPTAAQRINPDGSACSATITTAQSVSCNLLTFYPQPNLTNNTDGFNYYFASTQQSNSTQGSLRYIRAIGPNAALPTGGGRGGRGGGGGNGGRSGRNNRNGNQPLRQSININFNFSDSAADSVNAFPELGGKTQSHSYSLQTGYSLGYHRFNNNLTGGWNRTVSQTTNFYTNKTDIATELGILAPGGGPLNTSPLNYGIPDISLSGSAGLNEVQPSFGLQQTLSLSDTFSLRSGKHNYRLGGDYRRVHYDFLGSSNATGTFYFAGDTTDDSIANFVNNKPSSTAIQSSIDKSYLRENTYDLYAFDDFRALSNLTLNYGLRYEYFSPYIEKLDHLGELGVNGGFTAVSGVNPGCTGDYCATVPNSLVYPFRKAFSPRLAFALRLPKSTIVRGSYAISYTNGQYLTFAKGFARQPPYVNLQTNTPTTVSTPLTLEDGFPTPESAQAPNYSVQTHYQLPYVQLWNLDVQKTLPLGLLLNVGYNGSKGTHLDVTSAPLPVVQTNPYGQTNVLFKYEQSSAFSKLSAGTVRLNKRLQHGVSIQAFYQYSHSIDDAGSVGGTATVVAQNWQDLNAEESNSSFDIRHQLTGSYLFELPFGKDKYFLSGRGTAGKILEGLSISGSFKFTSGAPLTPTFLNSDNEIATNTEGSERPNRIPGTSITAGGGSVLQWFNTGAYDTKNAPANGIGSAPRNSIPGPGTISNNMSLSKTAQLGDTRSMELRATAQNVFNTVQYSGVDTNASATTFGQVTGAGQMRAFTFLARFRF